MIRLLAFCLCFFSLNVHPLGISQEIAQELEQKGIVVIFGAPGSGKTEQMQIALQGKSTYLFDLKKEFLNSMEGFSKVKYSTSLAKQMQAEWFLKQKDHIPSNADVVIFDEIDLSITEELNRDELFVLLEIVQLAKDFQRSGTQVVLIIHTAARKNLSFWEAMGDTALIETRYLTDAEEDFLLMFTQLTEEEKFTYKSLSHGLPAAYLSLMDFIFEYGAEAKTSSTYDGLIQNALYRIKKNISVVKTLSPEVFQTIEDFVQGHISLADLEPNRVQDLIYTGLVGRKNGQLICPQLVQQCTFSVRNFR